MNSTNQRLCYEAVATPRALFKGIVSSELCRSVRATYDNCVGDSSNDLKKLLCRQYMNKNLECIDLSQSGVPVVVEDCKL